MNKYTGIIVIGLIAVFLVCVSSWIGYSLGRIDANREWNEGVRKLRDSFELEQQIWRLKERDKNMRQPL